LIIKSLVERASLAKGAAVRDFAPIAPRLAIALLIVVARRVMCLVETSALNVLRDLAFPVIREVKI